ncbi:hypothetical protein VKT23_013780 [Stygiomarasmius scandens]|uniref:Uncharacterized protein n=1 Tax=Marasmiellus scandens TaxID=2682957 RepID=A0ABR1J3S9_9AGAR
MIRRCYIIWNLQKLVVLPSILISLFNNSLGLAGFLMVIAFLYGDMSPEVKAAIHSSANNMLTAFMATNVFAHVLLTGLIGGRIWWLASQLETLRANSRETLMDKKHYNFTIALILESGLLYPLSVIIFQITLRTVFMGPDLYPIMTQMAGIAPTLIIVRVQLGISINSTISGANVPSQVESGYRTALTAIDSSEYSRTALIHSEMKELN